MNSRSVTRDLRKLNIPTSQQITTYRCHSTVQNLLSGCLKIARKITCELRRLRFLFEIRK